MKIVFLIFLIFQLAASGAAQSQSQTYSETKELLSKMERRSESFELKKLFEEADFRLPDLIRALDDSDAKVIVNSQVIINYLGEPEGLKAVEEWKRRPGKNKLTPIMNLLRENKFLEGDDSDLRKFVLDNKHLFAASNFNDGEISVKLIGFNKKTQTALFEIIQGEIFTAGWHSSIRLENGKWRLISDSSIWVH